MSKTQITYAPNEVKGLLKSLLTANDKLMEKGNLPVSLSLVGPPGIGKTTIVRELATELKRGFYKLNLGQLTEPSELIGYYSKEYEVSKDGKHEWVTENMLPFYTEKGFTKGRSSTKPCPPEWVVNLPDGAILLLDDYSRGNSLFSQAIMELVNEQTMVGWDLRGRNIQIILTENPDDGENNVSSMDSAQADRMMRIHMSWAAKDWAERAEIVGVDNRLINFVLWMPELFENKKKDGISASGNVSPRMMDKFFSLVSTIDDFEKNLDKIAAFGDISVGKEVVGQLNNFINKNLDKLPIIEKLLLVDDETTAKASLTAACGDYQKDAVNYKGASAAILVTRMYNYVRHNADKIPKDKIKHYLKLVLHNSFGEDHKYMLVKETIGINNKWSAILAGDPEFIKYMTK